MSLIFWFVAVALIIVHVQAKSNYHIENNAFVQEKPLCEYDCHRRGHCINGECSCNPGWTGQWCQENKPWCPDNCRGHGICNSTTLLCECFTGFHGKSCEGVFARCPRSCMGRGICDQETGVCDCLLGYKGVDCSIVVEDTCPSQCSGHGSCIHGSCVCEKGFVGAACDQVVILEDICPNGCSAHGICTHNHCECEAGFYGVDCSLVKDDCRKDQSNNSTSCPFCDSNCSGHGICISSICHCSHGWFGNACEKSYTACPSHCSGHGVCSSNFTCTCFPGFGGKSCELNLGDICEDNCSGKGVCHYDFIWGFLNSKTFCECYPNSGFSGDSCSISNQKTCPKNCSGHGQCLNGNCSCTGQYTGLACDKPLFNCPSNCSGHGSCSFGSCKCSKGWKGSNCSIEDASCGVGCYKHGNCRNGVCVCDLAYTGKTCQVTCPQNCTNGYCKHGLCECNIGWKGTYCDQKDICINNCNDKGVCHNSVCECYSGYSGEDCSSIGSDENSQQPTCTSPQLNKCSNHGKCIWDNNLNIEKCECDIGFIGLNCASETLGNVNQNTNNYDNCTSLVAENCMKSWVARGCPEVDLPPSSGCIHYSNCKTLTESKGLCKPINAINITNNSNLTEFCTQTTATLCLKSWILNQCPSIIEQNCLQYQVCQNTVNKFCPKVNSTDTNNNSNTNIDCNSSLGKSCIQLWVDDDCDLIEFVPLDECVKYLSCSRNALSEGKCD